METLESAVARMKARGAEFSRAYNQHIANRARVRHNPALLRRWQRIKDYADRTKSVITTVNRAVDRSSNWLRDIIGGDGGIGALPALMPVAYVIAAIAAMTFAINEIWSFHRSIGALVGAGATPGQVSDFLRDREARPGFLGNITAIVQLAIIGGVAWFLLSKSDA
ncbi:MAG: hypothetical protein DDT21_02651 [Syntrophomonadaceae bacterium]|nr:hypothetical protein [Bacillota bacterium]